MSFQFNLLCVSLRNHGGSCIENKTIRLKSNDLCNRSSRAYKETVSLRLRSVCKEELRKVLKEKQFYIKTLIRLFALDFYG